MQLRPATARAEREDLADALAGLRNERAACLLGQANDHEPLQRGRQLAQRSIAMLAPAPSSASTSASSSSVSSRNSSAVRSTLACAAGCTASSAFTSPWRTRARA